MLTFREFYQICEGKKPNIPPHAVPGTFQTHRDPQTGEVTHRSYTLQPYEGPLGKPKKKEIQKLVVDRSGRKGVEKLIKSQEKEEKKIKKIKEDIEQLRKGIETLERQSAPRQRLAARRASANQRSRTLASNFKKRQIEKMRAQKEKIMMQQREEFQTEQSPTMEPNLYSQQVARRQAVQKTSQIKHVHQEIGAEARAQQAQKRAEMKAIMSR